MLYLGIDVGGSKIRGIILDKSKGRWFSVFNIKTPRNKKLFLGALEREIEKIRQKKKIAGIGIGLPGIIDIRRGILIKSPNLPFLNGWQAEKFFSKFKIKVKIDNDSRCFLRGEALMGAGQKYKNIAAIAIGTGIGGGLMIDGKIFYGKNNSAGEIGKIIIDSKKTFEQLGAKGAFLRYGDRSKIIGIGVANLINIFDPDIVILGGGGVIDGGVKIDILRKTAQKYIMSPLAKKTLITKGKLGEHAQALGACLINML